MAYKFRLSFHHTVPGFFRFDQETASFMLADGTVLILTARDADTLLQAARFHIDGPGFADAETARQAGERLRLRLRVLNSLLALGLSVPAVDTPGAQTSIDIKEKILREHDGILLDTVIGLNVFPDDGRHFEYVPSGKGDVYPSDPSFIFRALEQVWPLEMQFDDRTQDALEILGRSTKETSLRTKFLLAYLAAERMIERATRSDAARALIAQFQEQVRNAKLDGRESDALFGALSQLEDESFRSALLSLAERIVNPEAFAGKPLREFLLDCVGARNRIAHNAALDAEMNLQVLSDGLRQFVMKLIWTSLPPLSIDMPPSAIAVREMSFRIR
jgi:hypothetical protein